MAPLSDSVICSTHTSCPALNCTVTDIPAILYCALSPDLTLATGVPSIKQNEGFVIVFHVIDLCLLYMQHILSHFQLMYDVCC